MGMQKWATLKRSTAPLQEKKHTSVDSTNDISIVVTYKPIDFDIMHVIQEVYNKTRMVRIVF